MEIEIAGNKVVVAALPLKECIKLAIVPLTLLNRRYGKRRVGASVEQNNQTQVNKQARDCKPQPAVVKR